MPQSRAESKTNMHIIHTIEFDYNFGQKTKKSRNNRAQKLPICVADGRCRNILLGCWSSTGTSRETRKTGSSASTRTTWKCSAYVMLHFFGKPSSLPSGDAQGRICTPPPPPLAFSRLLCFGFVPFVCICLTRRGVSVFSSSPFRRMAQLAIA